jgi:hypothetical protein
MFSPLTSRRILYGSIAISAYAIYKHTAITLTEIFPILDSSSLASSPPIIFSAKSNYLQVTAGFITMGMSLFLIIITFARI